MVAFSAFGKIDFSERAELADSNDGGSTGRLATGVREVAFIDASGKIEL